jgi:hypothetical protein
MTYKGVSARHRMGVSGRAYRVLYEWARLHAPGFSGDHEQMGWRRMAGVTAADLLAFPECGQKTVDEIAAAMQRQGMVLKGHEAGAEPTTLTRGSRVYVAGRSREMVVMDVGFIGGDVLLRLRPQVSQSALIPAEAEPPEGSPAA